MYKEIEKEIRNENPFQEKFFEFFRYSQIKKIEKLSRKYPEKKSLEIDFNDLDRFDPQLADELLENPDACLEAAYEAMAEIDIPVLDQKKFKPHLRFYNLPSERTINLKNIGAEHVGKLICVEGVVQQITEVLPKLKYALWRCTRCDATYKIPQTKNNVRAPNYCAECKQKNFELIEDKSEFVDYQKITVQEPLEKLKGSEKATNLDIYVSDDMVNRITPGAKAKVTGIIRLIPPKEKKTVYGRYLEGMHIEETEKEFEEVEITKEEEEHIKELAKREDIYEMLVQSIAPHIYGHEVMKEAIALQLFGGVKKTLPNEQQVRGNIHILLVGDPGMAKSAVLKATDSIAPKSIYVAGKTSSGAGISATAVKDEFGEGGWTLKAGALVLASGGMAMIDEFDKMDSEDRSAMHEAMEQQSISVAKAGIVTKFKTETSILAAANPKYSRFDIYRPFVEQIDLPASLISRFDLFFMIKDVLDKTKDAEIASHILKTHKAGEMILQRTKKGIGKKDQELEEITKQITPKIPEKILKKYISYARQNVFPVLTAESQQELRDFYVSLRDQGRKEGSYSATHRQLEGLIRLSEASARVRLSDFVERQDVERAIRLVKTSLQDLVTDPETGKIDIDIITVGQTHTNVTNMKKILSIVREKASEMDMVPIEEIINEAKAKGIEADKTRDLLGKLKEKGDLYTPRNGYYKPTGKE